MERLRVWCEVYEHIEFGEISLMWLGAWPDRSRLLSLQADLWTPFEEVEDCLKWARNLQDGDILEGGEAVMAQVRP